MSSRLQLQSSMLVSVHFEKSASLQWSLLLTRRVHKVLVLVGSIYIIMKYLLMDMETQRKSLWNIDTLACFTFRPWLQYFCNCKIPNYTYLVLPICSNSKIPTFCFPVFLRNVLWCIISREINDLIVVGRSFFFIISTTYNRISRAALHE